MVCLVRHRLSPAGAVAVVTPAANTAANTAAVALYRSAGFRVVRESRDWVR